VLLRKSFQSVVIGSETKTILILFVSEIFKRKIWESPPPPHKKKALITKTFLKDLLTL